MGVWSAIISDFTCGSIWSASTVAGPGLQPMKVQAAWLNRIDGQEYRTLAILAITVLQTCTAPLSGAHCPGLWVMELNPQSNNILFHVF